MRRLVASPLFAVSIGVLVLNDHVLKGAWPGLLTGKLSDVAGVVMVAIALTALTRRPGIVFAVTAVAFTALETLPVVAAWAAPVLGGTTRTDPTDLVALVALVPLWVWVHHPERPATGRDAWTMPIRVALVGAAVVATSATSCGQEGVTRVAEIEGAFVAVDLAGRVFVSYDGIDWDEADDTIEVLGGEFERAEGDRGSDCVDGRCFEITFDDGDARVVEVTTDPAVDLLVLTGDQRDALDELHPDADCGGSELWSLAAAERPDGVHLVVATGPTGLLVMSPDGVWRWAAAGQWGVDPSGTSGGSADPIFEIASTPDDPPTRWGLWVARLLPAVVVVAFLGLIWWIARDAVRHGRRAAPVWAWGLSLSAVFVAVYASLVGSDAGDAEGPLFGLVYVAFALCGAVVLAVAAAIVWGNLARERPTGLAPPRPDQRVG